MVRRLHPREPDVARRRSMESAIAGHSAVARPSDAIRIAKDPIQVVVNIDIERWTLNTEH